MRPSLIIVTQGPHKHFVVEIQPASIKYQINSADIESSFEIYEAWQRHSLMNCILYLPCQWRPATPPTVPSPTCWFSCTLARQAVGLVSVHNYLFTHCPNPPGLSVPRRRVFEAGNRRIDERHKRAAGVRCLKIFSKTGSKRYFYSVLLVG